MFWGHPERGRFAEWWRPVQEWREGREGLQGELGEGQKENAGAASSSHSSAWNRHLLETAGETTFWGGLHSPRPRVLMNPGAGDRGARGPTAGARRGRKCPAATQRGRGRRGSSGRAASRRGRGRGRGSSAPGLAPRSAFPRTSPRTSNPRATVCNWVSPHSNVFPGFVSW